MQMKLNEFVKKCSMCCLSTASPFELVSSANTNPRIQARSETNVVEWLTELLQQRTVTETTLNGVQKFQSAISQTKISHQIGNYQIRRNHSANTAIG